MCRVKFRFLLLGNERLLKRCAGHLLSESQTIVAVVTDNVEMSLWAQSESLKTLSSSEYQREIDNEQIDYIISVTYPHKIPLSIINKAKYNAFNYHDGPLPKYAGMNCSAWAIFNDEAEHGIVWHQMTEQFDAGQIVKKALVTIEETETSVSLNIKNTLLALDLFKSIVTDILSNSIVLIDQDTATPRSFYSSYHRPPNLCFIDLNAKAREISCLVRACNFGQYTNPFGSPKLKHNNHVIIVHDVTILNKNSHKSAGVLISVNSQSIEVSTNDYLIELKGLTSINGLSLTGQAASDILDIRSGDHFDSDVIVNRNINEQIAKAEPYYLKRIAECTKTEIPVTDEAKQLSPANNCVVHSIDSLSQYEYLSAFMIVCSSLSRQDCLSYNLYDNKQRDLLSLSKTAPFTIFVDPNLTLGEFNTALVKRLSQESNLPGFLEDLLLRNDQRIGNNNSSQNFSKITISQNGARAPFASELELVLSDKQIELVSHNTFDGKFLESLLQRIINVLEQGYENSKCIKHIDTLSNIERNEIVYKWNDTKSDFPAEKRIFDLFDQQAITNPKNIAVIDGDTQYTYEHLKEQSDKLASYLSSQHLSAGDYVAFILERNIQLIITMLGISKSGAAYIPIDSNFPTDRIEFIINDANCKQTIVTNETEGLLPIGNNFINLDGNNYSQFTPSAFTCKATSDDNCYAIFTSGSTGKPKGVVLTHKAVTNTIDWVNKEFKVNSKDRLLFVTSPSFDLSVYDVFGILSIGASIDIASAKELSEPQLLIDKLVKGDITIWDSAPPALSRISSFFPKCNQSSKLRLVMLSGDWIPLKLPTLLKQAFPNAHVKSLGGATEAAIWSNYYHVDKVEKNWLSIPYGRPIQNAKYYILDHHLRPLPSNIPGNLYIGGVCLAKEYLNRLSLTGERFVQNPFVNRERIYNTGDLAKFWHSGTMEFLGRDDFQVKIRGYRIELGEIEAAIISIDEIKDAVCIAYEQDNFSKSLIGYVELTKHSNLSIEAMKAILSKKLPDYMIPSQLMLLDYFPLTANGKLDREKLPKPKASIKQDTYLAPSSVVEQELADIWQAVLNLTKIGTADNFFDIGGNSMNVVHIVAKIQERYSSKIPLSTIIENPTIKALANIIIHGSAINEINTNIHLLKKGGSKQFFFIYDGAGEVLLYKSLADRLSEEFTVYGITPSSYGEIPQRHLTVQAMARYCIAQINILNPTRIYLGGLCAGGVIAFEMAHQYENMGIKLDGLILLDAFEPHATPIKNRLNEQRMLNVKAELTLINKLSFPRIRKNLFYMLKIWSFTKYQLTRFANDLIKLIKIQMIKNVIIKNITWDKFWTSLSIHEIYMMARDEYQTPVINTNKVLLVKSSTDFPAGHADEPMQSQYVEIDLNWGEKINANLEIINVEGGHFSMLQEPYAQRLAEQLNLYFSEELHNGK
jgi:amino acid adenylation domain-containing protein